MAAGFNPEGGTRNVSFATRSTESALGRYLRLVRDASKPLHGFFLRAESFYNVATELEPVPGHGFTEFGGPNPHLRSHGEI